MTKYRKTDPIEAVQWHKMGDHPAVLWWDGDQGVASYAWIATPEGGHIVTPGDWIATGADGKHWPIKDAVFRATYEKVDDHG